MDFLQRTMMGLRCKDCDFIPKVPGAGSVVREGRNSVQIMHNGLRVLAGGYHGDWMAHLIRGLRGHHEPQEEALFSEVIRLSRHNSLIVELGSFWAYYSNWYLSEVPGSTAICVEPDQANMSVGKWNTDYNRSAKRARFIDGWVGGEHLEAVSLATETTGSSRDLPCFNANSILEMANGKVIEVLHMDVQGAETAFLRSLPQKVDGRIRFIVVSTHHSSISGSPETHSDCLAAIADAGAHVLAEHSVQESFSGDGLIVASFYEHDRDAPMPPISKNVASRSLFPGP